MFRFASGGSLRNPSAFGCITANECHRLSCGASVRPGEKGTSRRARLFFAAVYGCAAARKDQVSQRDLLPGGLRTMKSVWITSASKNLPQFGRLVHFQSFLRARRMRARSLPAFVGAAEARRRWPRPR